ncbi:bifunctional enoyl-CoA hydratase/phosphate acetyltransferase [Oceanotoga sp. DSM 15011]|uniref:bifunctional enoyl-CoA hydratase/phosphate acetyltransferase n=1 Tax=Oceanotoga sp. DSM 15011 TaxID=2984951 RepID=UPI0021F4AC62|nr:bifunctional enoyl-CoA hydratase/phosphate acetyltransferase [Oceanotoga sp. DSM 15011]UYP01124.1 bifunctional enoyl-CoA hydratase/phosphate acetyltransferase [Oceanotoga sp. DSM 15011]
MKNFDDLILKAKKGGKKRVVVVGAEDIEAIKAVSEAEQEGFAEPILVGNKEKIEENLKIIEKNYQIIEADSVEDAAGKGVRLVSSSTADVLMKGNIKTSTLLKAVLNKEWGLRTGNVLSHCAVIETEHLQKLIMVTDGGMIINPTLKEKISIIDNSVSLAHSIGIDIPKVALIAAVEVVNPDMQATIDAAILTQMNKRHQIKNCIIDGPLGIDNALDMMAAKIKKVDGDVAGKADILVVPDIHSGNFLGKSAIYFAGGKIAGLILGAKAPIIVVSRANDSKSKLASLALGVLNA